MVYEGFIRQPLYWPKVSSSSSVVTPYAMHIHVHTHVCTMHTYTRVCVYNRVSNMTLNTKEREMYICIYGVSLRVMGHGVILGPRRDCNAQHTPITTLNTKEKEMYICKREMYICIYVVCHYVSVSSVMWVAHSTPTIWSLNTKEREMYIYIYGVSLYIRILCMYIYVSLCI